jgi:hypothetical protein
MSIGQNHRTLEKHSAAMQFTSVDAITFAHTHLHHRHYFCIHVFAKQMVQGMLSTVEVTMYNIPNKHQAPPTA